MPKLLLVPKINTHRAPPIRPTSEQSRLHGKRDRHLAGPPPRRTAGAILDGDAKRGELVADPIRGGVVPRGSRGQSSLHKTLDRRRVLAFVGRLLEPRGGILLQHAQHASGFAQGCFVGDTIRHGRCLARRLRDTKEFRDRRRKVQIVLKRRFERIEQAGRTRIVRGIAKVPKRVDDMRCYSVAFTSYNS